MYKFGFTIGGDACYLVFMAQLDFTVEIDCSGMNCPLPVVKTKKELEKLNTGEILKVIATDPGSNSDIPAFCRRTGKKLLHNEEADHKFLFFIQK